MKSLVVITFSFILSQSLSAGAISDSSKLSEKDRKILKNVKISGTPIVQQYLKKNGRDSRKPFSLNFICIPDTKSGLVQKCEIDSIKSVTAKR